MFAVFINLSREISRREFMERQLNSVGVNYRRFPAVFGEQVPIVLRSFFPEKICDVHLNTRLSPGEIGCYASHLSVALALVSGELQEPVLVLEDDVLLPINLCNLLDEVVACAPEDWDLIKLSGLVKRPVKAMHQITGGKFLVRYWKCPADCAAYLISLKGAHAILSMKKSIRPIDIEIARRWMNGLKIYGVFPTLISHNQLPSVINLMGRRVNNDKLIELIRRSFYIRRLFFEIQELGFFYWVQAVGMHGLNHIRKLIGVGPKFLIR